AVHLRPGAAQRDALAFAAGEVGRHEAGRAEVAVRLDDEVGDPPLHGVDDDIGQLADVAVAADDVRSELQAHGRPSLTGPRPPGITRSGRTGEESPAGVRTPVARCLACP